MFLRRTGVLILIVLGLFLCVAAGAWVYNLTIVQDTIGWRISQLRADIKYAVSPPEEAVFTPDPTIAAIVESTLMAITPSPTTTLTPGPTLTPTPSPTASYPGSCMNIRNGTIAVPPIFPWRSPIGDGMATNAL